MSKTCQLFPTGFKLTLQACSTSVPSLPQFLCSILTYCKPCSCHAGLKSLQSTWDAEHALDCNSPSYVLNSNTNTELLLSKKGSMDAAWQPFHTCIPVGITESVQGSLRQVSPTWKQLLLRSQVGHNLIFLACWHSAGIFFSTESLWKAYGQGRLFLTY